MKFVGTEDPQESERPLYGTPLVSEIRFVLLGKMWVRVDKIVAFEPASYPTNVATGKDAKPEPMFGTLLRVEGPGEIEVPLSVDEVRAKMKEAEAR